MRTVKISALVVALALLIVTLASGTVLAAPGEVTGNVTTENAAPTINSVVLQTSGGASTGAMTPQVEFKLAIDATDNNTLADITEIDIWVYHDTTEGDGAPGSWDADDCALYKWVPGSGGTWTMLNSLATTWTVETGQCVTPTLTLSQGVFKLAFKPGKLAVASAGTDLDEWNFKVTVKDESETSAASYASLNSMAAYSQISTDVTSVTFGSSAVALGATAYIDTPSNHLLTTQVLANKAYALQVKSASTWTGAGTLTLADSGTPAAGEFRLNIDDATSGAGEPTTAQPVTATAGTITGHAIDARVATAAGAAEATANLPLYMGLTLGSTTIPHGDYSGTITFTVVL